MAKRRNRRDQLTNPTPDKANLEYAKRLQNRPSIIERLMDLEDINLLIKILELAYQETENEKVRNLLDKFYSFKTKWGELEEQYRQQELQECYARIEELPHAVQVFLLDYYDKDME